MTSLRAAVLVMVGCYSPQPAAFAPCSAEGTCPDPLTCENGVCVPPGSNVGDAATNDTSSDVPDDGIVQVTDSDLDGVLDVNDNCPTIANAAQHDEDLDARGDACDLCPHLPQLVFTNGDNDGLDDACDPNPGIAGDQIARFETFEVLPNDLTTTGTWTVVGDEVRQTATTGIPSLLIPGTFNRVTAEIGGAILTTPGTSRELKLAGGRIAAGSWFSCSFDDTDPATFVLEIENELAGTVLTTSPRTKMSATPFMIRTTINAGADTIACNTSENSVQHVANATGPISPGSLEVLARSTTFSLRYLIVITSP